MPCTKKIAALAALAVPFVSAASIADLPSCALTAASSGVAATGCMVTDYHCLCSATSFLTALQGQVMAECSSGDYQATLSFAQGICGSVGITLNLPAPNKPSTAAAAAAAAAPQATTAAPAATPAASGADDSDEDSHTPATDAAVTSSYGADAASTSTAIISTTTACTNGSANRTVATSEPVPFEGKAPGRRLQWASAALMVGVVGAFVAL